MVSITHAITRSALSIICCMLSRASAITQTPLDGFVVDLLYNKLYNNRLSRKNSMPSIGLVVGFPYSLVLLWFERQYFLLRCTLVGAIFQ